MYACACCAPPPYTRLRLRGGGYIFLEWHSFLGPFVFLDRERTREVEDWWDVPEMVEAVDWFCGRGKRG